MTVLINCDMGESFGLYRCGDDEGIMPHIDMANVACGFHASDPVVMQKTVRLAKAHGVRVGAHPSYPDLQGFGRREMKMGREELNHIKPHGALYGVASRDPEVANAIADAAVSFGVPVLGMAGTQHEKVYPARGLTFMAEYYADLDYNDEGMVIITREHDARDPAEVERAMTRVLTEGKGTSINGRELPMKADCVCVHSDTPGADELARAVKRAVTEFETRAA